MAAMYHHDSGFAVDEHGQLMRNATITAIVVANDDPNDGTAAQIYDKDSGLPVTLVTTSMAGYPIFMSDYKTVRISAGSWSRLSTAIEVQEANADNVQLQADAADAKAAALQAADQVSDIAGPLSERLTAIENNGVVSTVDWTTVQNKPAVVAAGATSQQARDAIGAVTLGNTSSTAKAGDWKPSTQDITNAGSVGVQLVQSKSQGEALAALGIDISGNGTPMSNLTDVDLQGI